MGTITRNIYGVAFLITLSISLLACSSTKEISGIYQRLDDGQSYGFGFTTLILRKDSTFLYNDFGDELCYQTNFGACGNWMRINDTIHLKLFDTISLHIQYLPDTSDQLTLEVFDNYDCQFLIPAYIMPLNDASVSTIGFGYFRGYVSPTIKEISIFTANSFNLKPLQIKRDSMHIQIHGMSMGYSHAIEEMRFVQKGSNLYQLYKNKKSRNSLSYRNRFHRKESLEYFEYMYQW